jgi:hypothetical protein
MIDLFIFGFQFYFRSQLELSIRVFKGTLEFNFISFGCAFHTPSFMQAYLKTTAEFKKDFLNVLDKRIDECNAELKDNIDKPIFKKDLK